MTALTGGAEFSEDGNYRYLLHRVVTSGPVNAVVFAALNPSKAGAVENDATVRRWIRFATDWGYQMFYVVNLFGYISTQPGILKKLDPAVAIGMENDRYIRDTVKGRDVVVCWGTHGGIHQRDLQVVRMLRPGANGPKSVKCFGRTKEHHPQHPLRLRADTKLIPYDVEMTLASGLLEGK